MLASVTVSVVLGSCHEIECDLALFAVVPWPNRNAATAYEQVSVWYRYLQGTDLPLQP